MIFTKRIHLRWDLRQRPSIYIPTRIFHCIETKTLKYVSQFKLCFTKKSV